LSATPPPIPPPIPTNAGDPKPEPPVASLPDWSPSTSHTSAWPTASSTWPVSSDPHTLGYAHPSDLPPARIKVMAILGIVFGSIVGLFAVMTLVGTLFTAIFLQSGVLRTFSRLPGTMQWFAVVNLIASTVQLLLAAYLIYGSVVLLNLRAGSMTHYRRSAWLYIAGTTLITIVQQVSVFTLQQSIFAAQPGTMPVPIPTFLFMTQILTALAGLIVFCAYPVTGLCLIRGEAVRRYLVK
jgi:hypothetical protein